MRRRLSTLSLQTLTHASLISNRNAVHAPCTDLEILPSGDMTKTVDILVVSYYLQALNSIKSPENLALDVKSTVHQALVKFAEW